MEMHIGAPSLDDAAEMCRVLVASWVRSVEPWLPLNVARRLSESWHRPVLLVRQMTSPDTSFLVARADRDLVGVASVVIQPDGCSWLSRLYVHPACQGQGIGTALLAQAARLYPHALRMRLDVELPNARAIAFYERHGFARVRLRTEWLGSVSVRIVTMESRRDNFYPLREPAVFRCV